MYGESLSDEDFEKYKGTVGGIYKRKEGKIKVFHSTAKMNAFEGLGKRETKISSSVLSSEIVEENDAANEIRQHRLKGTGSNKYGARGNQTKQNAQLSFEFDVLMELYEAGDLSGSKEVEEVAEKIKARYINNIIEHIAHEYEHLKTHEDGLREHEIEGVYKEGFRADLCGIVMSTLDEAYASLKGYLVRDDMSLEEENTWESLEQTWKSSSPGIGDYVSCLKDKYDEKRGTEEEKVEKMMEEKEEHFKKEMEQILKDDEHYESLSKDLLEKSEDITS